MFLVLGIAVAVILLVARICARLHFMRRGYHFCGAPGCGRLHPPDELTKPKNERSFFVELGEDTMSAKEYLGRNQ